jgi:ankyrin repeat protein
MVRWVIEHGADTRECSDVSWELVQQTGDLELMRLFLSNASKLDWKAWRALYWLGDDVETGISHYQKLSQVNTQDRLGQTALHHASKQNNYGFIQWLVKDFNADFNILDNNGVKPTALLTPRMVDEEFLEWLVMKVEVDSLGDPPDPVLNCAARQGNRKLIDYLVHVKRVDVNRVGRDGMTALLAYLWNTQATVDNELCRCLAGDGKSLNQGNGYSAGPLLVYLLCRGADLDVIKEWVDEKGADITAVDPRGFTAVDRAIQAGWLDFVRWLVDEKGADIPYVNEYGESPLMMAVGWEHSKIVKWLVTEKGADVQVVGNAAGQTALHWAQDIEVAKLLVDNGADIHALDDSPIDVAKSSGRLVVAESLASLKEA